MLLVTATDEEFYVGDGILSTVVGLENKSTHSRAAFKDMGNCNALNDWTITKLV